MTIVLIAGAWHSAWCWELVVPLLEVKGHRVIAPDLPGMGTDRTPFSDLAFSDWAHFVAHLAETQDEPVVLVGHSRAGIVISQAAELAPNAIRANVYLAAMLVPNGLRMADVVPQSDDLSSIAAGMRLSADQLGVEFDLSLLEQYFYNATSANLIERAKRRLTPEPTFAGAAVMSLTPQGFGRVPRAYIECLQDRSLPIALQRAMWGALPCWRVDTLDTDHSPFYSAPDRLADVLSEIASSLP